MGRAGALSKEAPDEIGLMMPALEDLVRGQFRELPKGIEDIGWMREAQIDHDSYQLLLETTQKRLVFLKADRLAEIGSKVASAIGRMPIRGREVVRTDTSYTGPGWRIYDLDNDSICVSLISGQPDIEYITRVTTDNLSNRIIFVCTDRTH
jgi:hypothetical protein